MNKAKDTPAQRIDTLMERASAELVARQYFAAERLCVEALDAAHACGDYERMSRILLPLQEARRFKRHIALDAGRVRIINTELPQPGDLQPGCYLVCPPRVGLDGRQLRELCDKQEVPAVIITREPASANGSWPVVALGPVTIRTLVPAPALAQHSGPVKGKKSPTPTPAPTPVPAHAPLPRAANATGTASTIMASWLAESKAVPPAEWFVSACEALGDAGIAQVDPARSPAVQVEDLYLRLQAMPDHEKLHQRLHDACALAARTGAKAPLRGAVDELAAQIEDDEDETPEEE